MKNRGQSERWHAAKNAAAFNDMQITYFEHDKEPRLRFSYGGTKLIRCAIDLTVAKFIADAYFPGYTIVSEEPSRLIIALAT